MMHRFALAVGVVVSACSAREVRTVPADTIPDAAAPDSPSLPPPGSASPTRTTAPVVPRTPPIDRDAGAPDANADAAPPDLGIDCATDAGHPTELGCTGLYSNWPSRTLAPAVRPYQPGLVLWSDGAEKHRYIFLPPDSTIDTSDMDEWTFPTGTKIWKEFRLNGAPVETRLLWKRGPGDWYRTTYVWSADGSAATEVTTGVQNVGGGTYEIPSQAMCTTCHEGRVDGVLGFEAVSLAAPGATGLTLDELEKEGLLSSPPTAPPVVPGDDPTTVAALGWLHANCGVCCHNRSPAAFAGPTGLFMRLDVATLASATTTDTWQTAVGVPSNFQPSPGANLLRIAPGDPSDSCIYFRADFRDDQGQGFQMPPIDTHVIDTVDVATLDAWIQEIPPQ